MQLDPTNYKGTPETLCQAYGGYELKGEIQGSEIEGYVNKERYNNAQPFQASEEEISEARANAAQYLVQQYGIDEISEQLGISDASDMEQQLLILNYIQANKVDTNGLEYDVQTTLINGQEFEISKAWELFCQANDIPYEFETQKYSNSIQRYSVQIDGKDYLINIDNAIGEDKVTSRTFIGENGYIWNEHEDGKEEYKDAIIRTRQQVDRVMGKEENEKEENQQEKGAKQIIRMYEQGIRKGDIDKSYDILQESLKEVSLEETKNQEQNIDSKENDGMEK